MTSPLSAPITTHGDFSINRVYDASPADVYAAWADAETKARWFIGPEGWRQVERTLDMRVGGTEILQGRFAATGLETLFTARYHLVEAGARLVYVYDMHLSGRHHSVSVATVEFIGDPEGTPIPTSLLLVIVLGIAAVQGAIGPSLWGGVVMLGEFRLHPLVLMFAVSGSLMISRIRIPKL